MRGVALSLFWLVIASCAPDYGPTAFRCDTEHACPAGQMCTSGRCRRGTAPASYGVECGGQTCDLTQQCCFYDDGGPRCIAAGDVCPDKAALCDGVEDCQDGDRCCGDTQTLACDARCNTYVCREDGDCPSTDPYCCNEDAEPWRECSRDPC